MSSGYVILSKVVLCLLPSCFSNISEVEHPLFPSVQFVLGLSTISQYLGKNPHLDQHSCMTQVMNQLVLDL